MYNALLVILFVIVVLVPVILYCIQESNMKHYQDFPRKPEEIKHWLERRKWYERFKTNTQSYLNVEGSKCILSGEYGLSTISSAFMWKHTPEGIEYWGKREYQFLRWYYGQWIDFHLTK